MFDTCNCEKSEDCMCAALSSYVRACAAKGVLLSGWRDGICSECSVGKLGSLLLQAREATLCLAVNWILQGTYPYINI